ncbi:MAG: DUF4954 family protein [Spirochaetales bacterium]|nr:DUF4954 family protein [Spirochaetales bacterium]
MSELRLRPLDRLGFDFVPPLSGHESPSDPPLPGRPLTPEEIHILEKQGNQADDWSHLRVREGFSPKRVQNCQFYGMVSLGALSPSYLEFHDLRLPVGLSNCTIVSSILGDNVALHNLGFLSRFEIGNRCILFNIDEMITTDHAKFGNGVVMDGEDEEVRIWLELANENGGRKVLPFDGMLPADAWIWSKYRGDETLMNRFVAMTNAQHSSTRGKRGRIANDVVIKDCRILKDVRIGQRAYVKGCNKLKNLTVNSDAQRPTQLGEGCELVNGIVGYGCRIFYGVKAVRFILGDHANLKYGARLINSILGSNSTISCCEVLNSLIFGSHEQHHNSSFLCATVLQGQSNMASAATVGSNHNSRSNDGEIVANRGFWPGLSVSLKHNSRFAAYCLVAKGAYPAELDVQLPFSLVSNSPDSSELVLMPGYWFRHNMYALARNSAKARARDARLIRHQELEYHWLAPDTVDQMRRARRLLEEWCPQGKEFLETQEMEAITLSGERWVENSTRPVRILRAGRGWQDYGRLIRYYAVTTLAEASGAPDSPSSTSPWINLGGQLVREHDLSQLMDDVRQERLSTWEDVHHRYQELGKNYSKAKEAHARRILWEEVPESQGLLTKDLLEEALHTAAFLHNGIRESRMKDDVNPFRHITFDDEAEKDAVLGTLKDNPFLEEAERDYQRTKNILENGFKTL